MDAATSAGDKFWLQTCFSWPWKKGKGSGEHTLQLQEQANRLSSGSSHSDRGSQATFGSVLQAQLQATGIHLLQPGPHLLSEHLLGTKLCNGLEDTQQVAQGSEQ